MRVECALPHADDRAPNSRVHPENYEAASRCSAPSGRFLASRVRCVADEECARIFSNQFPAILQAQLKGGELREARGSLGEPVSVGEVAQLARVGR
jgi:hypothetical protein